MRKWDLGGGKDESVVGRTACTKHECWVVVVDSNVLHAVQVVPRHMLSRRFSDLRTGTGAGWKLLWRATDCTSPMLQNEERLLIVGQFRNMGTVAAPIHAICSWLNATSFNTTAATLYASDGSETNRGLWLSFKYNGSLKGKCAAWQRCWTVVNPLEENAVFPSSAECVFEGLVELEILQFVK